ncbi:hypothetical protein GmHk_19G054826 [Glycine max]|nr:hypothetical protein GmHk_19G054826 [Glycine max]
MLFQANTGWCLLLLSGSKRQRKPFMVDRRVVGRGFILLEGTWTKDNKKVYITNVYAPCDLQGRRDQWEELKHLKALYHDGPWCLLGDFNSIRHHQERLSSSQSVGSSTNISEFNSWIADMDVEEVRSVGRCFTWCRPNGTVMSKLDRFLLSDEWLSLWPDTTQFVLDRDFSDHCPILLRSRIMDWGPKPLKVMDWWLKDKGFQNMVNHSWGNYHPSGWGGYVLKQKLKLLKQAIRQWSLQHGSVTVRKINDLKKQLNDMEAGSNASIISQDEVQLRKSLQEQLWSAALAYESMLRQKSRVKWIREGDRNSSYFHRIINRRRRVNAFQANVRAMKSILRIFELASGLKINYAKSKFGCLGKSDLRSVFQQHHSNSLINNFRWKVGDGSRLNFWKDKWREGDLSLKDKYPSLYNVSTQQNHLINSMGILVDNRWEWKFQWRRNLFDHEVDMAVAFMADIAEFQIQPASRDLLLWGLDTGGPYSTKAAYSFLKDGDSQVTEDSDFKSIWNLKIPPRASAFSWRLFKNRIPTKVNLRRRHVELPSYNCPLCDEEEETTGHILYSCIKTRTLSWETMSWVNRVGPFSTEPRDHFKQFSLWSGKSSVDHRWQVLWVALSMTIWKHRNSMVFNNQNFCSEKVMDEALFHTWSWLNGMEKSSHSHFNQCLELEINCEKTRSLWWETMRWVNRVGSYSIDPKNHFLQFTQWNSKDSTNKRWEFLWLALSFSIWYHRNAKIFKNQPFTPEKVMDDALFHTWSWIKCVENDFQMHFNFWSTNLKDVLS